MPPLDLVREIPLDRNGGVAFVDAADYDKVRPYRWRLSNSGYAVSWRAKGRKLLAMHRIVLGLEGAGRRVLVDHIDGDKLRNLRANLRVSDNSTNIANQQCVRGRVPFKGVCVHRQTGKYQAQIKRRGEHFHLGLHDDPMSAAIAYWHKAQELFGCFAWTTDEVRAEAAARAEREALERLEGAA